MLAKGHVVKGERDKGERGDPGIQGCSDPGSDPGIGLPDHTGPDG